MLCKYEYFSVSIMLTQLNLNVVFDESKLACPGPSDNVKELNEILALLDLMFQYGKMYLLIEWFISSRDSSLKK